jgi:hypothetical protein
MTSNPEARVTRRTMIAAGLGAAGAYGAAAIANVSPVAAVPNGNIQLGVIDSDNSSAAATMVTGTTDGIVTFTAVQMGTGAGLYGFTNSGIGVMAVAGTDGTGLDARSTNGMAAMGASYQGTGVYGFAGSTVAPYPTGAAAGVLARADDPTLLALRVVGRASFSSSGRATVAKNHSSVTVTKAGVTAASLVIATPKTNRAGVFVQAVVPSAGKFTVYLNKKVTGTTYVAYMVLG